MKTWQIGSILLLLAAVGGCAQSIAENASAAAEAEEEQGEPAVSVHIVPAEMRSLKQTVDALAQCEAPVDQLAMLTPLIEGHVRSILVEQGTTVKAGQPIVELDPKLPAADLAEKTATRDAAKASLELLLSLPRTEEQDISKLAIEQARAALDRRSRSGNTSSRWPSATKFRSSNSSTSRRRSSRRGCKKNRPRPNFGSRWRVRAPKRPTKPKRGSPSPSARWKPRRPGSIFTPCGLRSTACSRI